MTIGEDGQWKDKETLRTRLELLIDLLEERFKFQTVKNDTYEAHLQKQDETIKSLSVALNQERTQRIEQNNE